MKTPQEYGYHNCNHGNTPDSRKPRTAFIKDVDAENRTVTLHTFYRGNDEGLIENVPFENIQMSATVGVLVERDDTEDTYDIYSVGEAAKWDEFVSAGGTA